MDLKSIVRSIPDFPKPGIVFRDITPLLMDVAARNEVTQRLSEAFRRAKPDIVAGIDARGFVFGALVADRLGAGLALVRKKGKLPFQTVEASYDLEYGSSTIEMHADAVKRGQRVLIIDDLLATGGTAAAACQLIEKLGGAVVGLGFVIELSFLKGREKLKGRNIHVLIDYTSE